jgi:KTSC domain-containing protein
MRNSVRHSTSLIVIALLSLGSASATEQREITSHISRQRVHSRALAAVGYSQRLHALEVEFISGAIYRYSNVPPQIYRDLLGAASKAQFYDTNVRGHFPSVHVKPPRT